MKRYISAVLAVIMITGILSCCGSKDGEKGDTEGTVSGNVTEDTGDNVPVPGTGAAGTPLVVNDGEYSYYLQEKFVPEKGTTDYIMCVKNVPGALPAEVVSAPELYTHPYAEFTFELLGAEGGKLYYLEKETEKEFRDTLVIKCTNRDGTDTEEICRLKSREIGWEDFISVKPEIIGGVLYMNYGFAVDLSTGKVTSPVNSGAVPDYSDFLKADEDDRKFYLGAGLGSYGGKKICIYGTVSSSNDREMSVKFCLDDGKKEEVIFSGVCPKNAMSGRHSVDYLFCTAPDLSNDRIYYYDEGSLSVRYIDIKTGKTSPVCSIGENLQRVRISLPFQANTYLYASGRIKADRP